MVQLIPLLLKVLETVGKGAAVAGGAAVKGAGAVAKGAGKIVASEAKSEVGSNHGVKTLMDAFGKSEAEKMAIMRSNIAAESAKAKDATEVAAYKDATLTLGEKLSKDTGDPSYFKHAQDSFFTTNDKGDVVPHKLTGSLAATQFKGLQSVAEKIMQSKLEAPYKKEIIDTRKTFHEDTVINQAMQRIAGTKGDPSLARTELQRDAAAQGYNTITNAEAQKRPLSPLEYYDTLGQVWRAKTGTAPTVESMGAIEGKTLEQKFNNAGTFLFGKPLAANSPEMISNLKNYLQDTGEQLDRSHEAYMATHTIKPPGISDANWAPLASSARGLTFKDATDLVSVKDNKTGKIHRMSRKEAMQLGG